ncbi:MAG: hypothetical protein CM1200mP18_12320 [Gammaproteobacteria bacterium]|nr:MAG: hypothetical protein CM1200mP18_12320 [Gammaproteobacteria bacterium]
MKQIGTLDAIRMQVMWNRLISVVEEQAQALMRTAFSPIVRECGDLSQVCSTPAVDVGTGYHRHTWTCEFYG